MSGAEAEDWLSVAVATVLHLPTSVLDRAALEARRTCTHHAQIVPTIIREAAELIDQHHRLSEVRHQAPLYDQARLPTPELTQADCDAMPLPLRRLGLKAGHLVENQDGSVSPAPQAETGGGRQ